MWWVAGALVGVLAGCGARTGLGLDDAGRPGVAPARDAGAPSADARPSRSDGGAPRRDAGRRDSGPADAGPPPLDTGPPIDPRRDPTGLWISDLPPEARPSVIALHRRASGELLAYVLGASAIRQFVAARSAPDGRIELTTRVRDPRREAESLRTGVVDGDRIRMDPLPDGETATDLVRLREPAFERRWVLHQGTPDAPVDRYDFEAAFDPRDELHSGSLVARDACAPVCSGRIATWAELPGGAVIEGFSSPCTTYTITIDGTRARWEQTDCMGGRRGFDFAAARAPGSTSDHVQAILATLAAIADDLERGRRFAPPYAPVSPAYAHGALDERGLLDALNAEVEAHAPVTVSLTELRGMATGSRDAVEGRLRLWLPQTARFRDRRASADGTVYFDADTEEPASTLDSDRLAYLREEEDGAWRMLGHPP